MCPDRWTRQSGLGLVSSIFLITVVAILVVAITRTVRGAGEQHAQDVITQQAFLAAESGVQLALNRVFAPAGVGSCGNWSWSLDELSLPYCQADVQCRSELVGASLYYTLESHGRCDVGGYTAERRVLVRAQP